MTISKDGRIKSSVQLRVLRGEISIRILWVQQFVDRVASAFRPYQVLTGVKSSVLVPSGEGPVPGQPLSGIVGIEQVLSRLRILDAHLAKQHVQVVAGHVQFLAYLGHGEA